MALGGGTFASQNKILAGTYINFVSASKATATVGDRGYAAMALELDWGPEGTIIEVTNGDFQKNSMTLFGYDYADEKMKGLRDLFANAKTLYTYRLNGGGAKASNTYATAKHSGTRGNDLRVVIQVNEEETSNYDVSLYLGSVCVDKQTVKAATELKDNDYVSWKTDASLEAVAGVSLTGGTNGTADSSAHQAFLDKLESYPAINAVGVVSTEGTISGLYAAYTKRMREEVGVKFQTVVYGKAADYEGVVNVKNAVTDCGWTEAALVYWATGVIAGCAVNASNTNKKYDGEFTVNTDYTQKQLEKAISDGEFAFHRVGQDIRVLKDINSLVTTAADKGDIFKSNQTIRVIDQIATDIAGIFATKYLGVIPNDADGRASLWSDIAYEHQQLQDMRAIENFDETAIVVMQGNDKGTVVVTDTITVVNAMDKLYMTVTVQ